MNGVVCPVVTYGLEIVMGDNPDPMTQGIFSSCTDSNMCIKEIPIMRSRNCNNDWTLFVKVNQVEEEAVTTNIEIRSLALQSHNSFLLKWQWGNKDKSIETFHGHYWRIGHRIDISVAGCVFIEGQAATLQPN